jgi:hypothetical protein
MRVRVNDVLAAFVLAVLAVLAGGASIARAGEGQDALSGGWVPSLAVTGGVTIQRQAGQQHSFLFDGESANPTAPIPLRAPKSGEDHAVSPFIGGAIELMTPAMMRRFRLFGAVEVLPTFAPERTLTHEGLPSRIRGPQIGSVLAQCLSPGEDCEDNKHFTTGAPGTQSGPRGDRDAFGKGEANGQGMQMSVQLDQLAYGAKAGFSVAFQYRGHELRIKPSVGWIHYKIGAKGYMVDPTCKALAPPPPGNSICTNTYDFFTGAIRQTGQLRESILSAHDSGVFDGVGPGVDLEMQAGRFGPIGTALFLGGQAYYLPGDRDIDFQATRGFSDFFGNDTNTAQWNVRVAPWIYRIGLGVRFQWLGSSD